jgi:hypothetical protein
LNENGKLSSVGFYITVDTAGDKLFAGKYRGCSLFLANGTNETVELAACDSRIPMIAEAYVNGHWQPIEYLPSSWCGNSYHRVYLKPNQYWEFTVPRYNGKIKTRVRYRLALPNGTFVYSNEIAAGINKKQLTVKQGHSAVDMMDPYNE